MQTADRRSERRHAGDGDVTLSVEEPLELQIHGRLVDYSRNGFRAVHSFSQLQPGQVVHFSHLVGRGTARVMWNRIIAERVETGFLVIAAA